MVLFSTHNICFGREIRKNNFLLHTLSRGPALSIHKIKKIYDFILSVTLVPYQFDDQLSMFFSNTFHFQFSNKIYVIRAGIHKMLFRVANREDPDQTASSGAV